MIVSHGIRAVSLEFKSCQAPSIIKFFLFYSNSRREWSYKKKEVSNPEIYIYGIFNIYIQQNLIEFN